MGDGCWSRFRPITWRPYFPSHGPILWRTTLPSRGSQNVSSLGERHVPSHQVACYTSDRHLSFPCICRSQGRRSPERWSRGRHWPIASHATADISHSTGAGVPDGDICGSATVPQQIVWRLSNRLGAPGATEAQKAVGRGSELITSQPPRFSVVQRDPAFSSGPAIQPSPARWSGRQRNSLLSSADQFVLAASQQR